MLIMMIHSEIRSGRFGGIMIKRLRCEVNDHLGPTVQALRAHASPPVSPMLLSHTGRPNKELGKSAFRRRRAFQPHQDRVQSQECICILGESRHSLGICHCETYQNAEVKKAAFCPKVEKPKIHPTP